MRLGNILPSLAEFPAQERLGRVLGGKVEVKARPDEESTTVKEIFEDSVVPWLREGVGSRPLWNDQRYVETPDGFIYASNLQPVRNSPNVPVKALPDTNGMWVEVSVPYVDIALANPPGRSPWLEYTASPRLYYSQIMWVDQIMTDEQGSVYYRVSDRYGSFGDYFWAAAEAFRPIEPEEFSPIHPEVEDKLVVVDLTYQSLSCIENGTEVYYCRVSTGPKITNKANPNSGWATPIGKHTIWRKLISVHMTGGTTGGGYDLAGIGWTTLFASKGMAIHSTFWHNSYGLPQSHGCVNCKPEDAMWIFRWTMPIVPPEPGDVTLSGQGSTKVLVQETF
jgi:lipoprotein-anchoring transpeptidase ErfK/SrfK